MSSKSKVWNECKTSQDKITKEMFKIGNMKDGLEGIIRKADILCREKKCVCV